MYLAAYFLIPILFLSHHNFSFQLCTDLYSLPSSYFLLKTSYFLPANSFILSYFMYHFLTNLPFSKTSYLLSKITFIFSLLPSNLLHSGSPSTAIPATVLLALNYLLPIFICADSNFLPLCSPVHHTSAAYSRLGLSPSCPPYFCCILYTWSQSFLYLLPPAHSLCTSMSPFQSTLLLFANITL